MLIAQLISSDGVVVRRVIIILLVGEETLGHLMDKIGYQPLVKEKYMYGHLHISKQPMKF